MVEHSHEVQALSLDALLPHRAPMQLLDGVSEAGNGLCRAHLTVDPKAWYAEADGSMPAWYGLELLAQTIAAYSGATKAAAGLPARLGFLLGTQVYACAVPAFPAGSRLDTEARVCFQDESGLCAFTCTLLLEGVVVAETTLKVFEKP